MTNVKTTCALIAAAVSVTSCAPLQQAPLVYSSRQSLGIDFSTSATEQLSMSVNLGFKNVDAAYVPVAVAKPCDSADSGKDGKGGCTSSIYKLEPIVGGNNNTDSNSSKDTVESAQKVLADFAATNAAKKTADAAVNDAMTNLDKFRSQLVEKEAALQKIPSDNLQEKALLDKQITDLKNQVANAITDLGKKKEAAAQAQAAFDKVELSKLADALKTVVTASNLKSDAYSVFGSFNTNSTFSTSGSTGGTGGAGANATAGIALGKIFSTGVASQNLTEGIRNFYSRKSTYVECLNATTARLKQIGLPSDMSGATAAQKQQAEAAYRECSQAS